jgi:hypothetical protein
LGEFAALGSHEPCRRAAARSDELRDKARFADARFTRHEHRTAAPFARIPAAAQEMLELRSPADEIMTANGDREHSASVFGRRRLGPRTHTIQE